MAAYKSLNLDRKRIPELVASALPGATVQPLAQKGKIHECVILLDGKQALLHFYFLDDGTTTIHPKVGKNIDVSEVAAKHVAEYGIIDSRRDFSLALRNRQAVEVELLIDYLKETTGASLIQSEQVLFPKHVIHRMRSDQGDTLVIKFHANGTLQLQGKPLLLYRETVSFLSQYLSLEDVIRSQTAPCKVDIDPTQVADELAAILPTAHPFLHSTIVKILSASITLRKIDVQMEDYSSFVFPVLRGLEGYLKQLFSSRGVDLPKINSFGGLFRDNATGSAYNLTTDARARIGCADTCAAIQRCYSLFNAQRHGLFHIDDVIVASRIIPSRQEALDLINTVLSEIENSYIPIAKKRQGIS